MRRFFSLAVLVWLAANLLLPSIVRAQPLAPFLPPPTNQVAQRNTLNVLRSQVNWLRNATRAAPNYATAGYGLLFSRFQALRTAYNEFRMTLTPNQLAEGANDLAQLEAGLAIVQEAFQDYQQRVGAGESPPAALSDLCQALNNAAGLWLQQLDQTANRLNI